MTKINEAKQKKNGTEQNIHMFEKNIRKQNKTESKEREKMGEIRIKAK